MGRSQTAEDGVWGTASSGRDLERALGVAGWARAILWPLRAVRGEGLAAGAWGQAGPIRVLVEICVFASWFLERGGDIWVSAHQAKLPRL